MSFEEHLKLFEAREVKLFLRNIMNFSFVGRDMIKKSSQNEPLKEITKNMITRNLSN